MVDRGNEYFTRNIHPKGIGKDNHDRHGALSFTRCSLGSKADDDDADESDAKHAPNHGADDCGSVPSLRGRGSRKLTSAVCFLHHRISGVLREGHGVKGYHEEIGESWPQSSVIRCLETKDEGVSAPWKRPNQIHCDLVSLTSRDGVKATVDNQWRGDFHGGGEVIAKMIVGTPHSQVIERHWGKKEESEYQQEANKLPRTEGKSDCGENVQTISALEKERRRWI